MKETYEGGEGGLFLIMNRLPIASTVTMRFATNKY
jgi:hypothetical protein